MSITKPKILAFTLLTAPFACDVEDDAARTFTDDSEFLEAKEESEDITAPVTAEDAKLAIKSLLECESRNPEHCRAEEEGMVEALESLEAADEAGIVSEISELTTVPDKQLTFDITLTTPDGEQAVQVEFRPDARHIVQAVYTNHADGAPMAQLDKERIARVLQERLAEFPVGAVSRVIVTESLDEPEGSLEGAKGLTAAPSPSSVGCLVITGSVYFYTLVFNEGTPFQSCFSAADYYSNAIFNQCTGFLVDIGTYCCSTYSGPYAC